MNLKKQILKVVAVFGFLGGYSAFSQEQSAANTLGWNSNLLLGFDITQYSQVNVDGGFGFSAQFTQALYFSKHVGVFTGLGYASRRFYLNTGKNVGYLDIPFGLSFRYKGFVADADNFLNIGAYFGKPLSDFEDGSGTILLQNQLGFAMSGGTIFPVTENFNLGFGMDLKFAFKSPFEVASLGEAKSLSVAFGALAQLSY